jgi:hypothetical protein
LTYLTKCFTIIAPTPHKVFGWFLNGGKIPWKDIFSNCHCVSPHPPEYACRGLVKNTKYFAHDDRPLGKVSQMNLNYVTILTP